MARGSSAWVRRGLLAAVLVGAAIIPGYAAGSASPAVRRPALRAPGHDPLDPPAARVMGRRGGIGGTVPAAGQAYVSAGAQVAAVGFGMTVYAFDVADRAAALDRAADRVPGRGVDRLGPVLAAGGDRGRGLHRSAGRCDRPR